jgi:anti-anti-sigma regulatory factor
MLRILAIEDSSEQRLVLEGKLIAPWTTEVRRACEKARQNLEGRELVVDLKNLTVISEQGEDLLAALMSEGVKFRCGGLFAKQVLRQVARRTEAQSVRDGNLAL